MPGNSQRKGAIRKTGKGPTAGSGGRVKRGLEGKGPTPKAKDRPNHKVYKQRQKDERSAASRPKRRTGSTDAEWVAGRNSVVEVLRAGIPVNGVYVAEGADRDGRLREAFKLAAEQGISLLEVTKNELDRMTSGAVHQGLAARIPSYEYAHADDLLDRAAEQGEKPLIVVLDSVTDPRNLGAVVRSAAGFGAHGVVIPERRAAGMTASAWKTSAGAAARIPVAQTVNLVRQLKTYQDAGCMVIGLAADGDVDAAGPRPRRRPARGRRRLGGQGTLPPGRGDLRPAGLDPDGQPAGVAQRRRRRQRHPLCHRPSPRLTTASPRRPVASGGSPVPACSGGSPWSPSGPWSPSPSGVALFLNSSRTVVLASHDAKVQPTLGGYVVLHTGPVLPDVRLDSGAPIGLDVTLGKTNAASTGELVQRYAYIASQPEGQISKVQRLIVGMAAAAAAARRRHRPAAGRHLAGARAGPATGPARRGPAADAAVVAGLVLVLLVALVWQPWRGREPTVAGASEWTPLPRLPRSRRTGARAGRGPRGPHRRDDVGQSVG